MRGNIVAAGELWHAFQMNPSIEEFVFSEDMQFEELLGDPQLGGLRMADLKDKVDTVFRLGQVADSYDIDEGPQVNENFLALDFFALEGEYSEYLYLLNELYLTYRFLGICNRYEVDDIIRDIRGIL